MISVIVSGDFDAHAIEIQSQKTEEEKRVVQLTRMCCTTNLFSIANVCLWISLVSSIHCLRLSCIVWVCNLNSSYAEQSSSNCAQISSQQCGDLARASLLRSRQSAPW